MTSQITSVTTGSGNSGYYAKIGNIIIQWGSLSVGAGVQAEATVTLATAFSNTNYKLATTNYSATVQSGDATLPRVGTYTKTNFKIAWDCYNQNAKPARYFSYIAIGT